MEKIAFVFPGQGAQKIGMAKDFYDTFESSKEVFRAANEVLDVDIEKICFEEEEKINLTEYTQPALLTACTAMLQPVCEIVKPDMAAGLSLGEYTALVACKAMDFKDAAKLTRVRGKYMQNEVPVGVGGMYAVLGAKNELVQEVCDHIEDVYVANYNCPGQIIISGKMEALAAAKKELVEQGVKRVMPLKVSGPFHSGMLVGAGEKLAKELEPININTLEIPYVTNVTAEVVTKEDEIKTLLEKQVSSSVRWEESIRRMMKEGVGTFIEIGPGHTLTSLIKKIDRQVKVINVETVEDLEKLREAFQ
ncbi:MAG: ACP S-malonyltransferase [Lachnospiraceae bacterium]|jgi:[acyl-carrier-protein] S-malonyltransferase|nr:ACP S-malonyltransferase [Lachnospiraceae bacterium]